jgi:hypothetical protein
MEGSKGHVCRAEYLQGHEPPDRAEQQQEKQSLNLALLAKVQGFVDEMAGAGKMLANDELISFLLVVLADTMAP